MPDNNEIRDGLSNITDQQTDSVLINNAQHKRTARLIKALFSAAFLFAAGIAMWFYNLEEKIVADKPIFAHVFLDPERNINNRISEIDKKYPPMYEVWSGEDLVERWHWYSVDFPNSAQFQNWKIKCIANYSDGIYSGYTAHLMQGYPAHHADPETKAIKNSIIYKADESEATFTIWFSNENILAHGKRYKINGKGEWTVSDWVDGFRQGGENAQTTKEVKLALKNNLIVQNNLDYLVHISNNFTFLKSVLEI